MNAELPALLLSLAATALVYLASPQQRLRAAPLPAIARGAGLALLLAAMGAWCAALGPGAGIATGLAACMAAWVALPYLGWWRGTRRR